MNLITESKFSHAISYQLSYILLSTSIDNYRICDLWYKGLFFDTLTCKILWNNNKNQISLRSLSSYMISEYRMSYQYQIVGIYGIKNKAAIYWHLILHCKAKAALILSLYCCCPYRTQPNHFFRFCQTSFIPDCSHPNAGWDAYTLSHPENDRDVTESAQGYTLQDASFMRQSRCSFLNVWENKQVARTVTSVFLRNTRWRHGRSRGETKYSKQRWYNLSYQIYETVEFCWICEFCL